MAIVKVKKRPTPAVNLAAVVTMPAFRTREDARAIAKRLRQSGITPTAPVKTESGWRVTAKHVGGTLSIKKR